MVLRRLRLDALDFERFCISCSWLVILYASYLTPSLALSFMLLLQFFFGFLSGCINKIRSRLADAAKILSIMWQRLCRRYCLYRREY